MAPSPYTTTYTAFGKTYKYTYNYDYPTDTSTYYGSYNPFDDNAVRAAVAGYVIFIGVLIGIQVIGLIIVAIVYYRRQKRRKAWYGPMAQHYRNGGLPPWVAGGGGSVKAPLVQHDYSSYAPRHSYSASSVKAAPDYYNNSYNNSYPPAPPQSQYDPPNRSSTYAPYEAPPHQYRGY